MQCIVEQVVYRLIKHDRIWTSINLFQTSISFIPSGMGVLFIALATGKQWWRPESDLALDVKTS